MSIAHPPRSVSRRRWARDLNLIGGAKKYDVSRGTGLVNNQLYVGKIVWNRLRYIRDPDTAKRVSRINPKTEWIVQNVPELRIIDEPLWDAAKSRQGELAIEFAPSIEGMRAAHADRLKAARGNVTCCPAC